MKTKTASNVTKVTPATAIATLPAPTVNTSPVVAEKPAIELADQILVNVTSSWSPSEARETRDAVEFAIQGVIATKDTLMAIGDRFNKLKAAIGRERFAEVVKAVSKMNIDGLSQNNIGLWMHRATILAKTLPNPLVRKHILALAGGQGMVIRVEPTEEDKKNGETAKYEVAPLFTVALAESGKVPDSKQPSVCEAYARTVVARVRALRSAADTAPEAKSARRKKAEAKIRKMFTNFAKTYGTESGNSLLVSLEKVLEDAIVEADIAEPSKKAAKA